jgi:type I restriction-modification system DNA methylase subunit
MEATRKAIASFVDDLAGRLSAHELEEVLSGKKDDLESADLGNSPESYTEQELVYELLKAVGLEYGRHPYGEAGGHGAWPDFALTNLDVDVIGENKKLNNAADAVPEVKDYLDRKSIGADYGIATDGIEWYVFKIELGGDFTEYPLIEEVDLRPALLGVARERGHIASTGITEIDIEEELSAFVDLFTYDGFNELLSRTAPRELRDARKRDVEEFYDLYIELLFGEGEDYDYDTCLLDDIRAPASANKRDKRLFAVDLVNRLLFIKFLETRDVLADGFLRDRVEYYEAHKDELGGSLYETQLKPIFYNLLNTRKDDRDPRYRERDDGEPRWFADVPYLNGGLFRESVAEESRYRVYDRILVDVIRDLIEGSKLELNGKGFDPAIVGSVFEKTINHIEQERTQKDIGAYYTPNDVTEIVVEQSVDPRIRDVLVEAAVELGARDDDQREYVRENVEAMSLAEILQQVEDGEGWFGNANVVAHAHERLSNLKVVDPACGSGHFLTTAMDEIHRAQLSLMRGLNHGDDPTLEDRFSAKEELALNAIYGVDVDPIAAEIAKLRIWLKIVEGNGWKPKFGKLPNIDVNITDGNSLVGLPMTGTFDDVDVWSDDITEIEQRRLEYKRSDEGDPREIEQFLEREIRPALDDKYLSMFSKPVETEIPTAEQFEEILAMVEDDTLYPTFSLVRVERADGRAFEDDEEARLENLGFSVYKKSAKVDVSDRESKLKAMDDVDGHYDRLVADLCGLLKDGYVFSEVQRQPTRYDLDGITGKPFHWVAEFPEVADENGGRHTIEFDIVLGNPPYGDLLSDEERTFVSTYQTSGIRDISANFVERELQLLEEGGYLGNVTTLRLVYQNSLESFHDLLRDNVHETRIACFAKRPTKVFEGAEVRIALFTGQKQTSDGEGSILTSEYVRFEQSDRDNRLSSVTYENIDDIMLRDRIGGDNGRYNVIPKIGNSTIKSILNKLKANSGQVFRDRMLDGETEYVFWRREGADYWTNPMLEELYQAREVKPVYFETKLERDAGFLLVSSSIFYLYWVVYGNMHHLNWGQIEAFPFPKLDRLREHEDEISELADDLWVGMVRTFDDELNHFHLTPTKPIIEEVDALFGEMFGLTEEETAYVQNYHAEYGRAPPDDESITDY